MALPEFDLSTIDFCTGETSGGYPLLYMAVIAKRRAGYYVYNVYMPTLLIQFARSASSRRCPHAIALLVSYIHTATILTLINSVCLLAGLAASPPSSSQLERPQKTFDGTAVCCLHHLSPTTPESIFARVNVTRTKHLSTRLVSVVPVGVVAERLSVVFTLMLTSVAFKLVVAQSLPNLSYNTSLDWYTLTSFVMLVLSAVNNCIVGWISATDPATADLVDRYMYYSMMVIVLLWQVKHSISACQKHKEQNFTAGPSHKYARVIMDEKHRSSRTLNIRRDSM